MADYQSLLTRAVANLPASSPPSARQAIYERARKALVTQLRSLRPPLPEGDIAREETALDKAIAAVEANFAPVEEGSEAPAPPEGPPPAPPAQPASEKPGPAAAPREPAAEKPAAPPPAPAPAPSFRAPQPPPRPAAPGPRPANAPPARPSAPAAPPRPPAPPVSARPPVTPRPGAETPKPPPIQVPARNADAGVAPPVVAAPSNAGAAEPENLAAVVPSDQERAVEAPDAPPVVASRAAEFGEGAPALEPALDGDRAAVGRPEAEGLRPSAPSEPEEKGRSWPWAALAVVLGIVLSVAVVAILMRQKPQDLAINPPGPATEAPQTPAKIAQRAQPSPGPETASGPAGQPPQTAQSPAEGSAPAGPQAPQAEGQLPSAGRAAMLLASADNPQKPVVNLGSTVWSTIPAPQGQPGGVAVEADADIPDLKMHASMILRKNADPTLQATHTIDLKFTFQDGAPFNGFKDVGLPQMRKLDSTASEALSAVKVKIGDDYFLFALAKGDQDAARNLDLMRTRAWFDFPLLLNDDRIAKVVFQKSAEGQAMLEKAFDAWK